MARSSDMLKVIALALAAFAIGGVGYASAGSGRDPGPGLGAGEPERWLAGARAGERHSLQLSDRLRPELLGSPAPGRCAI